MKAPAVCRPLLLAVAGSIVAGGAEAATDAPHLSPRNLEAPFCYLPGDARHWPIFERSPAEGTLVTLRAARNDDVLAEGERLEFQGLSVRLIEQGRLEIVSSPGAPQPAFRLRIAVRRADGETETQELEARPAPPRRPLSYYADFGDELIRIFLDDSTGQFRPISKNGFDQYFRRLQAHGIGRLIVWLSPFPFIADSANYAPRDWELYERQARAIIDDPELTQALQEQRRFTNWGWLRQLLALRLAPDFGRMLATSAADHGIALTVSYRPFEAALTKYYEVPAFDADGDYLWGFLPDASPTVNYHPDELGFVHYRAVLAELGHADAGRLDRVRFETAANAAQLVERFRGGARDLSIRASRFPPLDGDSFVLVRQSTGDFRLQHFRDLQARAEARLQLLTDYRLDAGADGSLSIAGLSVPDDCRYLIVTASSPEGESLELAAQTPVTLWAKAGNRLGRETNYWVLDDAGPSGRETRVAGITPDGGYRAEFQVNEASIRRLIAGPATLSLKRNMLVIDLGPKWSVEMIDFEQDAARRNAIAEIKTLLDYPAFDEILLNTRSHTDLAMTVADGSEGQRPVADYWRGLKGLRLHLGLDKACAPRSVASLAALAELAADTRAVERITTWQADEWRGTCQSPDSRAWRYARNLAVAAGVRRLVEDLEAAFPQVRIRTLIPPRAVAIARIEDALDRMPLPQGGVYGHDYYERLWPGNNHNPTLGEGMAMLDLTGTSIEPVFLGSAAFLPDEPPFDLFLGQCLADMADNHGSTFRGPRSYFYEAQFSLREPDQAAARKGRERMIRRLLAQTSDINEVILYEAADWTYFLPLADPDLCGHGFLDREP